MGFSFLFSKALRGLCPAALRLCKVDAGARILCGSGRTEVVMQRYSYCGYDDCRITDCDSGAFCSTADNVAIGAAELPLHAVWTRRVFHARQNVFRRNFATYPYRRGDKTAICNGVWNGHNTIVKADMTFGGGALIGAGSRVATDVPPYAIRVGALTCQIRELFEGPTVRALVEL